MNYQSKTFRLHYRDKLIGTISNVFTDQPWFIGDIKVTEAFEEFREGFAFLTNENNDERFNCEPPIDLDNWLIEDDQGNRQEVELAIHDGNEIWWCW